MITGAEIDAKVDEFRDRVIIIESQPESFWYDDENGERAFVDMSSQVRISFEVKTDDGTVHGLTVTHLRQLQDFPDVAEKLRRDAFRKLAQNIIERESR